MFAPDTPLAIAQREGRRRVVVAADPATLALGVRAGQAVASAQACVPGLAVAEADPQAEAAALARLAQVCLRYAPLVAADPPDGVWIDIAGSAHLLGGEASLLADVQARFRGAGYAIQAAIADTPGAAHGWARFAPAEPPILPAGCDLQTSLAALPVAALRLPAETQARLHRAGMRQIGQLAGSAREPLAQRFGPLLLRRLDQALGRLFEPIAPLLPAETPAHRRAFPEPLLTPESLAAAIAVLAGHVCALLERSQRGARRLDLLFTRTDGSWQAVRIGTTRPNRTPRHLARLLVERLETVDPGFGIEAMDLRVTLAERLDWSQPTTPGGAVADDVAELVDRLAGRLGAGRVFRAAAAISRIPERSLCRIPAMAPATRFGLSPARPRPARLLDPPQPVSVLALLPDHPPTTFIWRRVRHRIRRADGPERVCGEWWRPDAGLRSRDYFMVEDDSGRRFWLFRHGDGADPASGDLRWFLHGFF